MQIKLLTLALKPRGDVLRSKKQGYQRPHKKDLCPPKIYKKNILPISWVILVKQPENMVDGQQSSGVPLREVLDPLNVIQK